MPTDDSAREARAREQLDPVQLRLPVHLLVLIYSLGRGDLLAALGPFRDAWRRGDGQAAYHVAERDLSLQAEEGAELLQQVQGHLLWQAYQSFFAVIFWYLLLGPMAALAYRLLALGAEHGHHAVLHGGGRLCGADMGECQRRSLSEICAL